jgi:hypothetical protein
MDHKKSKGRFNRPKKNPREDLSVEWRDFWSLEELQRPKLSILWY